jgi:hypothetical protein
MSPENKSVLQLLKEVTFRRPLTFYCSRKWGCFGVLSTRLSAPLLLLNRLVGVIHEISLKE